jgi:hypothetical protein
MCRFPSGQQHNSSLLGRYVWLCNAQVVTATRTSASSAKTGAVTKHPSLSSPRKTAKTIGVSVEGPVFLLASMVQSLLALPAPETLVVQDTGNYFPSSHL